MLVFNSQFLLNSENNIESNGAISIGDGLAKLKNLT